MCDVMGVPGGVEHRPGVRAAWGAAGALVEEEGGGEERDLVHVIPTAPWPMSIVTTWSVATVDAGEWRRTCVWML